MVRTYLDGMRLPVNPLEDVTLKIQGSNKQYEIVAIGEITKLGNRKLMTITINSLFVEADYHPFSQGGGSPESYVKKIKRVMDRKSTTRLVITGDGIDINMRCTIEDFSPSRKFGDWEDVYYTLSLKEYRSYSAKRLPTRKKNTVRIKTDTPQNARDVSSQAARKPETYTVKTGDCLWNIAKQYYGSGADYTKIYEANKDKISNPNLIYTGQTFVLP